MTSNRHEIPLITGFNRLSMRKASSGQRVFPSKTILVEMLLPGADMSLSTIKHYSLKEAITKVPNLASQLLLQQYSNTWIADRKKHWQDDYGEVTNCFDGTRDFFRALYHSLVRDYIDHFFMPNISRKAARNDHACMARATYKFEIGKKEEAEEIIRQHPWKAYNQYAEHYAVLKERFPEYRMAHEFIDSLPLEVLKKAQSAAIEMAEEKNKWKRESYHQDEKDRVPNERRLRQCPYCHCWYEVLIGGNGKFQTHCGEKACLDQLKNSYKSKKTPKGWEKASDKAKRCKGCRNNGRLVNLAGLCKECFVESQSR